MAGARTIFGELSYAPPQQQFVGGVNFNNALDRVGNVLESIDNRPVYSTNSLAADAQKAAQEDLAYESGIADAANNGDIYKARAMITQAAKKRAADLASNRTTVGAITKSVTERGAAIKKYDDLSDKEFDKTYANLALEKHDRQFDKRGGTNEHPIFKGTYQTYGEAPDIAAKVDINEKATKLGEGFKANERGTEGTFAASNDGLYRVRNGVKTERVDPQDVLQVVGNGLARDGELVSSLRQDTEKELFSSLIQNGVPRAKALDALNEGTVTINGTQIDVNKALEQGLQNKLTQAAQDMAIKYGYDKKFFTSDENKAAGADELAISMNQAKQQAFYSQAFSNPTFAKNAELGDKTNPKLEFDKFIRDKGINYKSYENEEVYTDADGNRLSPEKIAQLNQQYKTLKDSKTTDTAKLDILSQDNPLLAEIYKDRLSERRKTGKLDGLYKEVQERYNSKLRSLSTGKDIIYAPGEKQREEMQNAIVGKDGGLGLITDMNVRTDAGFIPFTIWFKEETGKDINELDAKQLEVIQKSIKIKGNLNPNDGAQIGANYKGKDIALSGSNNQAAEKAPIVEVSKVLNENLDKVGSPTEPIDFSPALKLPIFGYATGEDKWKGNKHEGRTATIHITRDIPELGISAGDTMSYEDLLRLSRKADITNNVFGTTGVTRGGDSDLKLSKKTSEENQ